MELFTRTYGSGDLSVVVLHGGPAAVGEAGPIAEALGSRFKAIEPYQRASGEEPLTVAVHVADLNALVQRRSGLRKPAIVGESWGAMLGLAYAASYPDSVAALALVGCGTFDTESRKRMNEIIETRLDQRDVERLRSGNPDKLDPVEQQRIRRQTSSKIYDYDPLDDGPPADPDRPFDHRGHTETWDDMLRLQRTGVYPLAFEKITAPVLMLHGDYDPHPGAMIYAVLKRYVRNIEYIELRKCGHSPWRERHARDQFFRQLTEWLTAHLDEG